MLSLERAHAQSLADRHRERIHRQTDCDQKQLQQTHFLVLLSRLSGGKQAQKKTHLPRRTDKSRHFMQNQRSVLPSMLALPRGGTTAPTTPLLRFMIAYAQPKVNMRAKLLPYANRKADTKTAAQAVRCARTAQAVRPVRAGSFAVNHSGELPLRAAGAQEGRQPAVFPLLHP